MSCHEYWPERCEFLNYEHCTEGDPMLLMPQIVAALEAAENIGEWLRDDAGRCIECGGTEDRCRPDICTVAQFKLALKGDEVAA
jgi:Na+-translocating ferredoxin:NAD+ oxidoreductase RnfC subunit